MSSTRADLAVIGGGQLARMMQQAAIGLGVRIRLLAEGPDVSAAQVIPDHRVGDYTSLDDLRAVVTGVPVVTFDHEHVPPEHLRTLQAEGHACRPGPDALLFAQDKAAMRERLTELGVPCPRHASVASIADLEAFGYPAVLKTTRGGYDGKGVWVVALGSRRRGSAVRPVATCSWRSWSSSVASCRRSSHGDRPVTSWHGRSWSRGRPVASARRSWRPLPTWTPVSPTKPSPIGRTIATELDVTGVLAVELFETSDGRLLVNELAMRPHNTGHWTIDGAATSQFENHLRAVLDVPLGPTEPSSPWSVMVNILGGSVDDLEAQLPLVLDAVPDVHVHLYGKTVKAGRKVGHVTAVGDDLDAALARARRAADLFEKGTTDG